jgi:hypothetical protein
MSATLLTCAETPLAWPGSITVDELPPQKTVGIRVIAPLPGPLTLEPRPARDGITVNEATNIGADYRGQRYSLEEAIFHVPGLHTFPGQKDVYPAEYHLHFTTFSTPVRSLTLVIPVSHKVTGAGQNYFAALAAVADPAATRPTLETLLKPGDDVLQYRGPDIRGRRQGSKDQPEICDDNDVTKEMQFLLVQTPCQIRASDLERIPREGTTRGVVVANDTAAMPLPGPSPKSRLTRDRLLRTVVLARPGILGSAPSGGGSATPPLGPGGTQDLPSVASEYTCRPIQVVDGQDVVMDTSGSGFQTLAQVLGLVPTLGSDTSSDGEASGQPSIKTVHVIAGFFSLFILILVRILLGRIWAWKFSGENITDWGAGSWWLFFIEIAVMIAITVSAVAGSGGILQAIGA